METPQKTKKRVNICIPNTGSILTLTVASMLNLQMPEGFEVAYNMIANCLVHEARDSQVINSIENDVDYLFFLDSDMMPSPNTLKQLISHDKDIVSAMCFKRNPPFQPCFYTKACIRKDEKTGAIIPVMESVLAPETWDNEGLVRVEAVGMACCLIKVDVFKKLNGGNWFFPLPRIGEDLTFCMKARQAGFKIYVDLGLNCHHLGYVPFGKEHYTEATRAFYADENNKDKNIFNEFA
jgi:GT2 family glycosyltransferase